MILLIFKNHPNFNYFHSLDDDFIHKVGKSKKTFYHAKPIIPFV